MRLWSINPQYLDAKGLVALWRESLLAQNVLLGKTKGYKNHPQLMRFKNSNNPPAAIASYLRAVAEEADNRGYHFDKSKIVDLIFEDKIPVTGGQIQYEFEHLLNKLQVRDQKLYAKFKECAEVALHPLFYLVAGDVEDWEIV
ncbi:MAG: pyrimidine dimer DNA glycosylase/endonuclease V [Nitrosomonas sp.]|nr:pyrimidine dimer DNA glycosylase/endonuclease V [Nitrosomonas sp.]